MKELLKNLTGKSLYLLLVALAIFCLAFIIGKYVIGTTSARYYASLIENDIRSKERNFQRLAANTALLTVLSNRTYDGKTLESVLDKELGYSFFHL